VQKLNNTRHEIDRYVPIYDDAFPLLVIGHEIETERVEGWRNTGGVRGRIMSTILERVHTMLTVDLGIGSGIESDLVVDWRVNMNVEYFDEGNLGLGVNLDAQLIGARNLEEGTVDLTAYGRVVFSKNWYSPDIVLSSGVSFSSLLDSRPIFHGNVSLGKRFD